MTPIESPFLSRGVRCAGTLLLPDRVQQPAVIVMAHGFAGIRAAGLYHFAERFVQAGYAVYAFDYRNFGDSDGEPRHWVSARRHLQDWKSAIQHVRQLPQIDKKQLVLWGTSFSGGHVIQTAATDNGIAAVIAQVPHVSGIESLKRAGLKHALRLSLAGWRDVLGSVFNRPGYSPVVGKPHEVAAINVEGAVEGYLKLLPANARWDNKVLSRIFLLTAFYNPIWLAHKIKAPTLIVAGRDDEVTPAGAAQRAANLISHSRFVLFDGDHFQLHSHTEPVFERNMDVQIAFLTSTLAVAPTR